MDIQKVAEKYFGIGNEINNLRRILIEGTEKEIELMVLRANAYQKRQKAFIRFVETEELHALNQFNENVENVIKSIQKDIDEADETRKNVTEERERLAKYLDEISKKMETKIAERKKEGARLKALQEQLSKK